MVLRCRNGPPWPVVARLSTDSATKFTENNSQPNQGGPNYGPAWSATVRSGINRTGPTQPQPSMDRAYGQLCRDCSARPDTRRGSRLAGQRRVSWWEPGPGGGQAISGPLIGH